MDFLTRPRATRAVDVQRLFTVRPARVLQALAYGTLYRMLTNPVYGGATARRNKCRAIRPVARISASAKRKLPPFHCMGVDEEVITVQGGMIYPLGRN
jgi:hypothetical protein